MKFFSWFWFTFSRLASTTKFVTLLFAPFENKLNSTDSLGNLRWYCYLPLLKKTLLSHFSNVLINYSSILHPETAYIGLYGIKILWSSKYSHPAEWSKPCYNSWLIWALKPNRAKGLASLSKTRTLFWLCAIQFMHCPWSNN